MSDHELTGRFPPENIGLIEVPEPPAGVIEKLSAISGVSCLVSDTLDEMGIAATHSAEALRPVITGRTVVGPALTIRKVRLGPVDPAVLPVRRGDIEAHNLTRPGDVLVIEGQADVSCMGGISALLGNRQGSLGAVIWGGCRDVADLREIDYPVWSLSVTPLTGTGRVETEQINFDVQLGHVLVRCGDIVVADDNGVCILPRRWAADVTDRVLKRELVERERVKRISCGVPVRELSVAALPRVRRP